MTTYQIRNWGEYYEKAQKAARLQHARWVAISNKHDGKGFRRIMRLKNGPEIYGAWVLILAVASKCPKRGILADDDGPLSAEDLEIKTGCAARTFEKAFEVLCSPEIAWLSRVDDAQNMRKPCTSPEHGPTENAATRQDITEQDSTEQLPPSPTAAMDGGRTRSKKAAEGSKKKGDDDEPKKIGYLIGQNFVDSYRKLRRGVDYRIDGADRGAINRLKTVFRSGEDLLIKRVIEAYLYDNDPFLQRTGWKLQYLATRVQKYMQQLNVKAAKKAEADHAEHDEQSHESDAVENFLSGAGEG